MPITLNHSNISVQYSSDKSYIIETVKSDLYLKNDNYDNIVRNNLQTAPVTPSMYIENGTNNVYAVESYTYSGSANTADFTRVFPKSTTCDILIVGGGGSGDRQIGGGGGGGAVLYANRVEIPADTYIIKVGKGGSNGNGGNSEAFGATCLGGGSTAYVEWPTQNNGTAGGSGSGGSPGNTAIATGGTVGTSTKGTLLNSATLYNGNIGGNGLQQNASTSVACGGGGGGAGTAGFNSSQTQYTTRSSWIAGGTPSKGGDGIPINITGTTYYWGAGGGGAGHRSHAGDGGLGGGGGGGGGGVDSSIIGLAGIEGINSGINGSNTGTENGGNGAPNTGSGGGGGGYNNQSATNNGGNGGSGIVIIRYLLGTIPANNLLTNEPVVIAPTFTESVQPFQHSGGTEAQTIHTITIGRDTVCDILIVGGGGSGDRQIGGGGGGGAVLYATNITIPAGSYTLKVGKGGENGNGGNSEAFGATCLGGGSTPFTAWGLQGNGNSGGSGSGGSSVGTGGGVGVSTKGTLLSSGTLYNGNVGGNSLAQAQAGNVGGGGGGGAGTAGFTSSQTAYTTRSSWITAGKPSNGGDGIPINITGTTYYWGAGGGGCGFWTHAGDGGLGGGGGGGSTREPFGLAGTDGINSGSNGLNTGTENGGNGGAGTGSGGGGGSWNTGLDTYNGGKGGSGIVIIKYKSIAPPLTEGNPITHKTLNLSYTVAQPTYTLNFPVHTTTDILERTAGRSILNNSNLILRGIYDINMTASSTQIVPRTGQYLPFTATSNLSQNIAFRYHLLNPIKMPEGAQWTYNSSNVNVYHLGNVGIGTTNPNYNLDVSGTIFTSTGGYTQSGLTNWTVMSDRRIKENIVKASYEKCLENVKNIKLYSFNFKDNCVNTNDKHQLGFIAQEVQQVYPKAVEVGGIILNTNEPINDVLTLNTTQIDYTLYGAVKYLIQKVEMLEQKLEKKNAITNSSNVITNSSNVITNSSNVITNSSNAITNSSNVITNSANVITNSSNTL